MRISIILGTRPEIIKLSPIIRESTQKNQDFFILHTGQHYSYKMDQVFFEKLEVPGAEYNLEVGSGSHAEQTGKMLIGIEQILKKTRPDIILVQGDTNTVLAGSLAAAKLNINIGHVEAGLRSYDRRMPEEINRILADHCSDLLFAPTPKAEKTLLNEGIPQAKIHMTGNTIVDATLQNLEILNRQTKSKNQIGFDNYFLATVHRQKNVDEPSRFKGIISGLEKVFEEMKIPIIYPIHPRAQKQLKKLDIETNGIHVIEPLDYLEFLELAKNAQLILTDSGGVQEEACILGVPCVTLRDNTERPETLEIGANILAGTDPEKILRSVETMQKKPHYWNNPFGDGKASEKIIQILRDNYE